jgi:aldehyde dehydrogenase (NAD+)
MTATLPDGSALIGDAWVGDLSGGVHPHVNPATGLLQKEVGLAGPGDIDRAVAAAHKAFPDWRALPVDERRTILARIAELFKVHTDELAGLATLESGLPSMFGPLLCGVLPSEYFTYYAGWVDKIEGSVIPVYPPAFDYTRREPYGTVAVLIPWNGPLTSIGQKVAPALAAGNCVILKPPELAPFTALRFGALCLEAGLPPGVLNVVPSGPQGGEALVSHPGIAKISFTGGGVTAEKVLMAAARNLTPVLLELGGKSANLVFADADLDAAVTLAVQTGVATLSGQGCLLPTRLLVEDAVYDEVVEMVVDLTESLVVGDPFSDDTIMGPVVSAPHCERILGVIDRALHESAGRLLTGGARLGGDLAGGYFIAPTVFGEVDNGSHLAQNEIFGPVLSILRFRTEAEAVQLANATRYGLGGYLHTRDLARAHRVADGLQAGYVAVNGFPLLPPNAPFGGMKASGHGREGGKEGLDEFLQTKNIFVNLDS